MPPVKSLSRSSEKWSRQSAAAQPEYVAGVQQPRKDWADATSNAAENYAQGVQQAIQDNRFQQGVRAAGTSTWQSQTLAKGPGRWADGIRKSTDRYEKGFAPFRQVIENIDLPARGPKGDPRNIERVAIIANALHQAKVSGQR